MDVFNGQVFFNILVSIAGFAMGWILNTIWQEIKQLQKNERENIRDLSAIKTFIAGEYTTRAEFNHFVDKVLAKLDTIADKLNGKMDRKNDQ